MRTLHISLPESMRDYIDKRVAEGGHGTASEYIQQLIQDDQQCSARQRIDALLLESLESGEPIEVTDEWWQRREAELLSALEKGQGS